MFQHAGSPLLVLQPHRKLKSVRGSSLQDQKTQLFTASFKVAEKLLTACTDPHVGKITKQQQQNKHTGEGLY